jgi:hypothetical protein
LQWEITCFVVAISGKISPFCHRFYSGCKI